MNRKTARENAFILVFEKNFRDEPLTSIIEDAIEARNFEYDDYVEKVFCGIFDNLSEIDAKITELTDALDACEFRNAIAAASSNRRLFFTVNSSIQNCWNRRSVILQVPIWRSCWAAV